MSERDLIERLDEAIEASLAGAPAALPDPDLAMLLVIAADLRGLPDPRFKQELKRRILPMTTMTEVRRPAGFHTVTPYLSVTEGAKLTEFLKEAFGAKVLLSVPRPDGSINHSELTIGDSVIELGEVTEPQNARRNELHLYVEDADAVYASAVAAGARSLYAPMDQPYGDREAGIADPSGNYWYIATHGESVRPEGVHSVTPFLHARGAAAMIDFLKAAFDAREASRDVSPDGVIQHAVLYIGDSAVEIGEAHAQWEPMPCALHLFVDDADRLYEQALRAGAKSLMPPSDTGYGQHLGGIIDDQGNQWYIATML